VAEKTIITTQANNDDVNHDEVEVNAPGDGSITAFAALNHGQLDDMNVGTITEDNNDNHDEVNAPGDGSVTAIAALNHGQLDDVNVGTTTEYNNENYEVGNADNEQAQDSMHHINPQPESLSQQLLERINALEDRINHLEEWKRSTSFPYCTEDIEFSVNDSFSGVREENDSQLDDGNDGRNDTGKNTKSKGKVSVTTLSIQPNLQRKRRGDLLQRLMK